MCKRLNVWAALLGIVVTIWASCAAAASPPEGQDEVLARIGNTTITRADLDARLRRFDPPKQEYYKTPKGQMELLQQMIRIKVFSRRARELGMDQDPGFKARIRAIENTFLASDYARKVASAVTISDAQARKYYEQHPAEFHVPEQIQAPSITVGIPAGASDDEIAKRRARIEDARIRALQGKPFIDLIKEYDENHLSGGYEFFSRGRLVPEIEDQVFDLQIGEVSPVLQVPDAFLLFKLEARRPPHQKPFDEVRNEIISRLKEQERYDALESEEGILYKKYGVVLEGQGKKATSAADGFEGEIVEIRPVDPSRRGGALLGWLTVKTKKPGTGPTVVATILDTTKIAAESGRAGRSFADLKKGQQVFVGASGPVVPTAPPRVSADSILVHDRKAP